MPAGMTQDAMFSHRPLPTDYRNVTFHERLLDPFFRLFIVCVSLLYALVWPLLPSNESTNKDAFGQPLHKGKRYLDLGVEWSQDCEDIIQLYADEAIPGGSMVKNGTCVPSIASGQLKVVPEHTPAALLAASTHQLLSLSSGSRTDAPKSSAPHSGSDHSIALSIAPNPHIVCVAHCTRPH